MIGGKKGLTLVKQLLLHTERCKSCGYCVRTCPKNALEMSGKLNKIGYEYVLVNPQLCVCCGSCYVVCPDIVFEITETEVQGR